MSIDSRLDAILAAIVRQCVIDVKAGPGSTYEQRKNFRTAADWCDRAELLERICEAHQLNYDQAVSAFLEFEERPAAQRPKVVKLQRKDQPVLIIEQRAMLLLAA